MRRREARVASESVGTVRAGARAQRTVPGGKHLLSFAGDEDEGEDDQKAAGSAPKRIMAATEEIHDGDAATLAALTTRAVRDPPPPQSRVAQSVTLAEVGDFDETDAAAFDASQRGAIRKRPRTDQDTTVADRAEFKPRHDYGRDGAIAASSADYSRLRDELRASRKAAAVGSATTDDSGRSTLLTPLQEMRAKYKARHKELGRREEDTLSKLTAFRSKLAGAAASVPAADVSLDKAGAAAYAGQVLEDDTEGGDDGTNAWMQHKLKFKKHIDDSFRAGDDGLETIDPLRDQRKEHAPLGRGAASAGSGNYRTSSSGGSRGSALKR
jgi:hypothetical protein